MERVEKLRLGPGWEDDTDIGPVINKSALDKIHSYTEIGKDEGAKLLTGGEVASDGDLGKGFFYRPTVFGGVEAGITYINAGTIGAEVHLPFGGTKDTGNGHREAGQAALDVFTEWKSIYVDYSGKLQKAQIDTAS